MIRKLVILLTLLLLLAVNFSIWSYYNNPLQLQPWTKTTMGVTYDPMRKQDTQTSNTFPSAQEIENDFALLTDKVFAVRTYNVSKEKGLDKIPELAAKHNLNSTVGAWIGLDLEENRRQVDTLIEISKQYNPKLIRLMVGNEVLLRGDVTEEVLIGYIRDVKGSNPGRPISTSETWEGIAAEDAVDYVFDRYNDVKKTYPNKPVIITEVGWPSDGQPVKHAAASVTNQAKFLRDFLNRADKAKVNYYVVEAFDQPWKKSIEGSAGAYWGIFNADRLPKYPMDGDVMPMPDWENWAAGAAFFSLVLMGIILLTRSSLKLSGIFFFGLMANLAASVIFWTLSSGAQQYQTTLTLALWGLMVLMQVLATVILLIESLEIAEIVWHRKTIRTFQPLTPTADFKYPKVSLHLPIHNEPPLMVRKTLEALAKVDYPNFEVLVMDNNTKDDAVWIPVKEDCERLGERFRFFHLENWPGFKAGAINHALDKTAEDAEIIALIDSDYVLSPDWLKSMVPYFDNQKVGFIQSPQDYRDRHQSTFKEFSYWEYAGFFNIGMVQRNEYNAIIQHGTMTMIRKSALIEVGRWSEWCICEDSELGIRLYEAGYDSVYVKDSFGKGLMPDTFSGYMTQRFRWVYGAMQIIKAHWKSFLPTSDKLTSAQKYYFVAGWLPWFSDALALVFTVASLIITVLIRFASHPELPSVVFLMPTVGLFAFKIIRGLWLYQARVPCSVGYSLGAALSGLSLTHTVAIGTIQGLFTSGKPFMRTPKYESQGALFSGLRVIQQEILLLLLLGWGIFEISRLEYLDNLNGRLWMAILAVQAVPYFATLITTLISIAPSYFTNKSAEELDDDV